MTETPRIARAGRLLALALCLALPAGAPALAAGEAEAVAAFEEMARVLSHPRCLNCHQPEAPLQKAGRAHLPAVTRGPDNLGPAVLRCANCHSQSGNNPASGVPGAPHWQLAPLSMSWAGMGTGALCRMLRDEARNGGRDGAALIEHMGEDPLVLWGWQPGAGREPVSLAHDAFMAHVETWVAGGQPCPE